MSMTQMEESRTLSMTESGAIGGDPESPFLDPVRQRVGEIIELTMELSLWLYVPILVLGVVGNALSFHLLWKRAKTSSTYTYLATLSVMDTIFLVVSVSTWITLASSDRRVDLRLIFNCNTIRALKRIPKMISAWLLVAVSIERCLVVYLPTKAKSICHLGRSKVIILMLIPVACLINWNSFGTYRTNRNPSGVREGPCPSQTQSLQHYNNVVYGWLHSLFYGYLPSLAIIVLNSAIVFKFVSASRANKVGAGSGGVGPASSRTMAKNSMRMTVTGVVLSGSYLILTLPQSIHDIYFRSNMDTLQTDPVFYYTQWFIMQMLSTLFHLNHAINLALYCLTDSGFRRDLVSLLLCKTRGVRGDSESGKGTHTKSNKTTET